MGNHTILKLETYLDANYGLQPVKRLQHVAVESNYAARKNNANA
jgi:hypothetical protein